MKPEPYDRKMDDKATKREELIDCIEEKKLLEYDINLIKDALGALTHIECDCGRSLDISRHIDRTDIENWLKKRI